jgi:hypothetical protein
MERKRSVSGAQGRVNKRGSRRAALSLCGICAVAASGGALGESAPAEPGGDVEVKWNTTLKYSASARTRSRNDALVSGGSSAAQDDGDRNFSTGLISSRLDVLSELDIRKEALGARLSAAGWYDPVYKRANDNDSPGTSQGPGNQFPSATAKLHGGKAELLDAFVFYSGEIGGKSASVKLGRHALVYGESLFFGGNGIAYAMVPIDVIKATSVPASQFRELMRPVNQLSAQFSVAPGVSVGGYYQLRWERTRLPGVGSYMSSYDMLDEGGRELQMIPPIPGVTAGYSAVRTADKTPGNSGQGGLQLRWSSPELATDFGLYAVRYHERIAQLVLANPAPSGLPPFLPQFLPTQYHLEFASGVTAVGMSFSTALGSTSIAGELSVRNKAALAGDPIKSYAGQEIPRGKSAHLNLSALMSFDPNWVAREATAAAELACNRTLSVSNGQPLAANSTRSACALRVQYEPKYRQVASGFDLSVPVSVGYTTGRSSAIPYFGPDRGGDVSVGLNTSYLDRWRIGLSFTHYYGSAGTVLDATGQVYSFKQSLADRDYVSLSLSTTF